jgi:hypothetical protein
MQQSGVRPHGWAGVIAAFDLKRCYGWTAEQLHFLYGVQSAAQNVTTSISVA